MFCPHCGKEIQPNASLNYCPSCGKFLTEDVSEIRKQTIVKLAKFDLPPQALFESCISSVDELGLTIDKIDRVSRYIEAVTIMEKRVLAIFSLLTPKNNTKKASMSITNSTLN